VKVRFTKAHGAKKRFLLTWRSDAPPDNHGRNRARPYAIAITGIGADGWMLVDPPADAEAEGAIGALQLRRQRAGISGNGTRCAAAFLIWRGYAPGRVRIRTGRGSKTLRMLQRSELKFEFEMNMGRARIIETRFRLAAGLGEARCDGWWTWAIRNAPCRLRISISISIGAPWGAEIERHLHFPDRTNVSFFRSVDAHSIDVRFYERGAGETMSSGTGSTGARIAAVARGMAQSPVRVLTPAGPLDIRLEDEIFLTGPPKLWVRANSSCKRLRPVSLCRLR